MLISGYWILNDSYPYFIRHPVSSIQYLVAYGANVNFIEFFIFGSGSVELGTC
jgi:hypothetical protein